MTYPKAKIGDIHIPERLRKSDDEHMAYIENELAPSIKEFSLLQPIVLNRKPDGSLELVAGFSRLTAHKILGLDEIEYKELKNLTDADRHTIELEENVRRLDMPWQDRTCAIAKIHQLRVAQAASSIGQHDHVEWTQKHTGAMLKIARSGVSTALQIAALIEANDEDILACTSFDAARQILASRKQKSIESLLHARQLASITIVTPPMAANPAVEAPNAPPKIEGLVDITNLDSQVRPTQTINLGKILFNTECISLSSPGSGFMELAKPESFDFIYTDIPYGIDMDSVSSVDISMVEAEHDVEENIKQMPIFLREAYRILKPNSFCVFWFALEHYQYLRETAESIGFSVQKWPLTWHKISGVKNSAPGAFWPKNQEYAMVCRKGVATLRTAQLSSVFSASNDEARKKYGHPFSKPESLTRDILSAFVIPGMIGLDPYAGRGSMLCAGLQLGITIIGVEKQPEHFARLTENVKTAYSTLLSDKSLTFIQ